MTVGGERRGDGGGAECERGERERWMRELERESEIMMQAEWQPRLICIRVHEE